VQERKKERVEERMRGRKEGNGKRCCSCEDREHQERKKKR
jgi:hypothetical protein